MARRTARSPLRPVPRRGRGIRPWPPAVGPGRALSERPFLFLLRGFWDLLAFGGPDADPGDPQAVEGFDLEAGVVDGDAIANLRSATDLAEHEPADRIVNLAFEPQASLLIQLVQPRQ